MRDRRCHKDSFVEWVFAQILPGIDKDTKHPEYPEDTLQYHIGEIVAQPIDPDGKMIDGMREKVVPLLYQREKAFVSSEVLQWPVKLESGQSLYGLRVSCQGAHMDTIGGRWGNYEFKDGDILNCDYFSWNVSGSNYEHEFLNEEAGD